jgi:hypothetical protein
MLMAGGRAMTEAEWLAATDPTPMLKFMQGRASGRKLRLLAVACCRRIWHLLVDEQSRNAVDVAERFADGLTGETQRQTAADAAMLARFGLEQQMITEYPAEAVNFTIASDLPVNAAAAAFYAAVEEQGQVSQVQLTHDIFGNPFRPVTFSPSWRTDTGVSLARQMYESRDFSATPILADALQDAGCDNEHILNHCRDTSLTHVRGCWVVDLLLDKK